MRPLRAPFQSALLGHLLYPLRLADFAERLTNAAATYAADRSADALDHFRGSIDAYFRTRDIDAYPPPGESDGVVLLETGDVGPDEMEGVGFMRLVSSQLVTPLRIRFRGSSGAFEIRLGDGEEPVHRDELERRWRRGRLPEWDDDWDVYLPA